MQYRESDVENFRKLINRARRAVFFGGAGVSTESGIPDFRSQDGLYAKKYAYPPEYILSHTFFCTHTREFFEFYRAKMLAQGIDPERRVLKYAELWNLGEDFVRWLEANVVFADTLVDRIVSGYPKAEAGEICARLGYTDALLDVCELFFLWVIEADAEKLACIPLQKSGLQIVVTRDLRPYRTRKVRILNGAHTMSVLLGHLAGYVTVEQMLGDEVFCRYLEKGIAEEIIPSFEGEGLSAYAASVFERFRNPFLNHKLLDISLNSVSKWKTRVLCSVKDDISRTGNCPPLLCFSLAGLIAFYKQGADSFVRDDAAAVRFIAENSVAAVVKNAALWGEDLSLLHPALRPLVEKGVALIAEKGPRAAVEAVCNGTL